MANLQKKSENPQPSVFAETGLRALHTAMNHRSLLLTSLLILLLAPAIAVATIVSRNQIKNGGYILFRNGQILEQYHADDLFVPASTIKLLTALAALKTLGPDYQFTTSFYIDAQQVLYIRGGGDPILTTESLAMVATALKERGVTRVSAYVLDDSLFQLEHSLPSGSENSTNPYDVANSGLAVNFNSIGIIKHKDSSVSSAEKLTPLTPLGLEIGQQLAPGKHRVNIGAFGIQRTTSLPLRYSAELLHELLVKEGIASQAIIRRDTIPKQARLIYQHMSMQPVLGVVRSCLYVSNNFMANQLALTAGAIRYGYPATWEKALKLLTWFAREIGISPKELNVMEGSGLSRQTRITPAAMLKILKAFEPYRDLLPKKNQNVFLKSGTMENIYCYAGYQESGEGPVLFVFLLNQPENTRKRLLAEIQKRFAPR